MERCETITQVRSFVNSARMAGDVVAFVPTMGNLHNGHLSLIAKAKASADRVLCSIFVNGLQFGQNEDLDRYPRTLQKDCELLAEAGCDLVFHPTDAEIYPDGMADQTRVICPTMTDVLCGGSRPGHFEGVTTVVTKLFNIVQPDIAVFGEKDFQQLAVIRRMARDLCMPVQILAAPTWRDADGLAVSSRNSFIESDERGRVTVLYRTLTAIADAITAGNRDYRQLESEGADALAQAGFQADYFQIMNSDTLLPAAPEDARLTLLGAMLTAKTRLIDNVSVILA